VVGRRFKFKHDGFNLNFSFIHTQVHYTYTQVNPTTRPHPPSTILKMSSSSTMNTSLPIVNDSKGACASSSGTRVKECVHCHTWCGNASKSCKSCKHPFPHKTTGGHDTRQGKSHKVCGECGTEAAGNNTRVCKNAACGHKFPRAAVAATNTSLAVASSKKRRHVSKSGARKKRKPNAEPVGDVDPFVAILESFRSEPTPYAQKNIAQEQQVLLSSAADSVEFHGFAWDPDLEFPLTSMANTQCNDIEPFECNDIEPFESSLNGQSLDTTEDWERQLMDELNGDWLDHQTAAILKANPAALPVITASPAITV